MAHRISSDGNAMRWRSGFIRKSCTASYRRASASTLRSPTVGPLSTGCNGVKPYCSHSARCYSAWARALGRKTSGPARYSLGLRWLVMSRPSALALFLPQCLVHLLQQTLHVWEVWLEVPRFPQVQRCGGELSPLHVELAE